MKNTAILLISCPDRKGIVATVSGFLYQHGANILHADEHQDSESKQFFQRIEWDLADFDMTIDKFKLRFSPIASKFQMTWKIALSAYKTKVAIFVSREDHCLSDLLYRHKNGELNCNIILVVGNHPDGRRVSNFYGIPFFEIKVDEENKKEAENQEIKILKKNKTDLLVLARYMQILSPNFIRGFANPIINIHHSFLPAFMGARPYHQAHERGVKIIGATSHYVIEELDKGPIIEQDIIRISHRDSIGDLIQKGRDLERIVLSRAVKWHVENRILTYANKTVIFD